MKLNLSRRMILVLVIIFMLAALVPATALAQTDRVRFTVQNKSDKVFTLWMTGPEYLYLVVEPKSTEVFTPLRGEYTFTMFSCGVYADSSINLSSQKKMIVPACGASGPEKKNDKTVDASDTIKLVKVTMKNATSSSNMVIILTGPSTYVFSLKAGQSHNYTIARGVYDVTYYACSGVGTREFSARAHKILELKCP